MSGGSTWTALADFDFRPNTTSVTEELRRVHDLMQLEQREDQAQFKLKNAKASIQE